MPLEEGANELRINFVIESQKQQALQERNKFTTFQGKHMKI